MSKLLGGAQYILTGRFGQHIACKKPFTSWCLWALAGGSPWETRLCGYHSPAGAGLAGGCPSRAPGTLFLLFIQTSHGVA